ncbi:MAG: CRISPR-associated endonuclease Cas2 [Finegoldia magna]|jgi:CRISPR-associated endoribonuclease cas2|uniref:CRISPR-associated endoribonuclease Cas2 n=1 Tax=Finegoldia magna TaxID=1260 RepID=A0A233V4G4_FINMA|nr:CRISPR-associated endonuclease Cas2 [Finegoldia magna]MCI6000656.1 CRISPR-associated endonuclease Cas2 [Finegoldia magna]MDU1832878.1 CRISPR-associated endonuclease Cas2 [Finegoldia magna]MDU1878665.1 CRISPR-associated endonuclease Cas2 [Finegoldia magna]MDU4333374.1 CRISPR-associated endonuclease Cas2 [Finegoldia magna]MDU5215084.1 CRISPR-associated endonuclease Cas2 [Finegoldia magna]
MYIILVYDISNENNGQRRWNRVFKICKQYLNHIQNSVFEGEILESDLFKLKKKIKKEIDEKIDSVIIFKSRNERWLEKDILGTEIDDPQFI